MYWIRTCIAAVKKSKKTHLFCSLKNILACSAQLVYEGRMFLFRIFQHDSDSFIYLMTPKPTEASGKFKLLQLTPVSPTLFLSTPQEYSHIKSQAPGGNEKCIQSIFWKSPREEIIWKT
jgi:hypothetical protein